MTYRPLVAIFGTTLFLSAFLIFSVQPMTAKLLLPYLGGSPSVWNTAMVFFQAMLLAGYGYAHLIARYLPLSIQIGIHLAILGACAFFLPIALPPDVAPPVDGQALWQLGLMLTIIGGPFFVLAASAPLFQHWFASSGHPDAENPYFLYAVSNAGSMAALLGYPFLIEPFLKLSHQSGLWLGLYILLLACVAVCGLLVFRGRKPAPIGEAATGILKPTWKDRAIWIGLAFIPSSLLLGVTTHITTDIATAPFLWIIPLTLYLLTFIIAFSRREVVSLPMLRDLAGYGLCLILLTYVYISFRSSPLYFSLFHLIGFMTCAQLCHSQLAALKPRAAYLTEFFLLISLGGVIGGIFNALIAPQIFVSPYEYPLVLFLTGLVIWGFSREKTPNAPKKRKTMLMDPQAIFLMAIGALCVAMIAKDQTVQIIGCVVMLFMMFVCVPHRGAFALLLAITLFVFEDVKMWAKHREVLATERDYFGIMTVYKNGDTHSLEHGTTMHGAQYMDERRMTPTTYYSPKGPAADLFHHLDARSGTPVQIAGLGLGVGSIACYSAPNRFFDFYEISKAVVDIAQNADYFTYLRDCGSPYRIILGDARLKIQESPNAYYDLIFIDTFSSDNIPVHVMTEEAIWTYLSKLKQGGIIAFHISNRYMDLRYPLSAIAENMGLLAAFRFHIASPENRTAPRDSNSLYVIMSRTPEDMAYFTKEKGWLLLPAKDGFRPWRDDYANVPGAMQIFHNYD